MAIPRATRRGVGLLAVAGVQRSPLPCHRLSHRCLSTPVKTFANQSKLPRLPVPTLENLSQKYLASCKPLLSEEDFATTEEAVGEFVRAGGVGEVLQGRLVEYEKKQKNSWLEDIWLNKAYLEWREPSLINVNWWCQFKDHPKQDHFLLRRPPPKGAISAWQVERTAGLISNFLNFKDMLDNETLPPEYQKDTPLDMNQYKTQFGACRIPGSPADTIHTEYPSTARHIVVLMQDQIYKVDVIREDGARVPLKELERLLFAVGRNCLATEPEPPIGLLTAGQRDNWAQAHTKLLALSPENAANFETIKTALFAVCLDDYSPNKNLDISHHHIFHGFNAKNRWFDKTLQLIVGSNGRAGVNGEHSPADATTPGKIFDYILSNEPAVDPAGSELYPSLPDPVKLKWTVDEEVEQSIKKAEQTALALIKDTDSNLFQTTIYGSRFMKEVAQCSPDAYVQIALQLAYYRASKTQEPTAVYESASTRMFLHGRTETGRSMTEETWAFVKSFDDDNVLYDDKRALFQKAIKSQSTYMREASLGRGIDRHMLGLRSMIQSEEEGRSATLFNDKAFGISMNFRLSTSNMSPGKWFWGGFGPVVQDGYGVNYAIDKDELKFSISSRKSCEETSSHRFKMELERVLIDMFILFPKRSEVWGAGWAKRHGRERMAERYLTRMKSISDGYLEKREEILKRYQTEKKDSADQ
ncbi:hypothetical protein HDV00_000453 [Rhizophlyctis rosea]|nr:hypothetical protein HDV00_000453 [Rhizophlyctis rosea]